MSISRNRLKVHTKDQIRDLNGKFQPIFLSDTPQNAQQC